VSTAGSGLFIGARSGWIRTASLPDLKELGSDYPSTQLDYEQIAVNANIA
jgi:hypothetical protein